MMMKTYVIALLITLFFQSAGAQIASEEIASLKKQAEAGDPKAQVRLGTAYASGDGVAPDGTEAVKWFRKAAEQENAAGEYSLSEMYLTGRGVTVDVPEGLKFLRRSAEHGDPRGQANLAALYAQGQGVQKDESEAAKWMRKAADQGLAAGQFGLGSMYAHGTGLPKSDIEAAVWYRKAADQGDAPAMNNLAFLLAKSSDPKVRNPKEAVSVAQDAVEVERDNPSYLDTLATTYFEAGEPDKAAEAERRAVTLRPGDLSYKRALEKYQAASR